ncbi:MAG: hypothetical protein LBB74_09460 [Chitinispirillales bacterium]|jgi:predicted patatin/cPLA2 family phospholipase|nr:hypothetical protein [Chitinispirillales bacterium]
MLAKKVPVKKAVKKKAVKKTANIRSGKSKTQEKPKRLSKLGEWMRAHPNGIGLIIHDMRAVMK